MRRVCIRICKDSGWDCRFQIPVFLLDFLVGIDYNGMEYFPIMEEIV